MSRVMDGRPVSLGGEAEISVARGWYVGREFIGGGGTCGCETARPAEGNLPSKATAGRPRPLAYPVLAGGASGNGDCEKFALTDMLLLKTCDLISSR